MIRSVLKMILVLAVLSACAPPGGGGFAAFDPARTQAREYLQIVTVSHDLVEIEASGRLVRLPAPAGYCVPRDAVMSGDESVFFIMERCGPDAPGLLSVSVGAAPLAPDGDRAAELQALAGFLQTDAGARSLGFDAGSGATFLIGTEIRGPALYALVEDAGSGGLTFAGRNLVRAFTELNGRLTVLTLVSMAGDRVDGPTLKARMIALTEALIAANAGGGLS